MNAIFAVPLISLFALSSFASTTCYQALNPRNITIKTEDESKIERAISARVVYKNKKTVDREGIVTYPNITLRANSKTMRFLTTAYQFDETKPNEFGVECDGGTAVMQKWGGIMVMNSPLLAGEIKHSNGDGCNTGVVKFKDLALEQVPCK